MSGSGRPWAWNCWRLGDSSVNSSLASFHIILQTSSTGQSQGLKCWVRDCGPTILQPLTPLPRAVLLNIPDVLSLTLSCCLSSSLHFHSWSPTVQRTHTTGSGQGHFQIIYKSWPIEPINCIRQSLLYSLCMRFCKCVCKATFPILLTCTKKVEQSFIFTSPLSIFCGLLITIIRHISPKKSS